MYQQKAVKMIQLSFVILLFSFLFASCGDDDPVKPTVDAGLNSVGGFYYKAVMGAVNNIEFSVGSPDKVPMTGSWVHFNIIIGDGSLVNDSVQVDANGKATCQYNFDGVLGHAELQALVRNVDTTTVTLRASTLIPGVTGQGQYILMEDRYEDIKNFNGTPLSVDVDPTSWILYAVYESNLGVVFVMEDINRDSTLTDSSHVLGIIVNTVYTGKTSDSLGIGSTMGEVGAVYGGTNEVYDPTPPPAYSYKFPSSGLTFWADTSAVFIDRVVFEIHLTENVTIAPSLIKKKSGNQATATQISYKRFNK